MSDAMVNHLSSMEIDEVSFVDRGAHQLADVVFAKNDSGDEVTDEHEDEVGKASPAVGDMHVDRPLGDEEEDETDEDDVEKSESFLSKVINKFGGMRKPPGLQPPQMGGAPQMPGMQPQMPGMMPQAPQMQAPAPQMPGAMPGMQAPGMQMPGQGQAPGGLAPLPQEAVDYIKQLEEQVQRLSQQGASSGSSDSTEMGGSPFGKSEEFEVTPDSTAILSELAKSLEDEEQRELVSKALDLVAEAEERAATAEEIAKAEREHRLNREFVELAKSYINLPVSHEELGPVLKRLYESLDEDDIAVIEKCLKASDERLNGLFEEVGKRGGYESSVVSRVEAEAMEISKSHDLTREAAIEQVLASNPSVYDEYVRESAQMAREV